jgi:hypothetical protein
MSHIYIVSKAKDYGGGTLAMAAAWGSVIVTTYKEGDDTQLWEKRSLSDGTYALINKATYLCVRCQGSGNGAQLDLVPLQYLSDQFTHWRDDNVAGPFNAINSLANWEQKINIPGDGPYGSGQYLITWKWGGGQPNELWQQQPAAETAYTLQSLVFDTAQAKIATLKAVWGAELSYTNNSPTAVETPLTASVPMLSTYGFTPNAGNPGIAFAYHGPRPVLDVNRQVVLQDGDWQYAGTATSSVTQPFKTYVYVPAWTIVAYGAMQSCAQLTVPYTATLSARAPDGTTKQVEVGGTYSAMCSYALFAQFEHSQPVPERA